MSSHLFQGDLITLLMGQGPGTARTGGFSTYALLSSVGAALGATAVVLTHGPDRVPTVSDLPVHRTPSKAFSEDERDEL
jgi:hypothetical protein